MLNLILRLMLILLLSSCSPSAQLPTLKIMENALTFQINLVQQELVQGFNLQGRGRNSQPRFDINRFVITQIDPMQIEDLPGFQIQGTYDLTIKFAQNQIQRRNNRFKLYLQSQKEGKTWRLARPQGSRMGGSGWLTYSLPNF